MGRPKFRPPQLPHFSTDCNETQNQERYPGYDPTCKIWLMWDDGKGVCVGRAFSVAFCVLSIYPVNKRSEKTMSPMYLPQDTHQTTVHSVCYLHMYVYSCSITACAIATSCCRPISDVPSQWEGRNFNPHSSHILTDLDETWKRERHPKYDPTGKIWLMWDDGKGVCVGRAFSVTFCVLSFFVFLPTPTGHTRRLITTVYGSKRVFPRKVGPSGGRDDKK